MQVLWYGWDPEVFTQRRRLVHSSVTMSSQVLWHVNSNQIAAQQIVHLMYRPGTSGTGECPQGRRLLQNTAFDWIPKWWDCHAWEHLGNWWYLQMQVARTARTHGLKEYTEVLQNTYYVNYVSLTVLKQEKERCVTKQLFRRSEMKSWSETKWKEGKRYHCCSFWRQFWAADASRG